MQFMDRLITAWSALSEIFLERSVLKMKSISLIRSSVLEPARLACSSGCSISSVDTVEDFFKFGVVALRESFIEVTVSPA